MKGIHRISSALLIPILSLGYAACSPQANENATGDASSGEGSEILPDSDGRTALAELQPTAGNQAHGIVTFTETEAGIRVEAEIEGLQGEPGPRGFHIHETGDCSAPDATSAGGHFNPDDMDHGSPTDTERHAGDFGNLVVDEQGIGRADFTDTHISFDGPNSIIGRAVIVHAEEDDLTTQPTGDAGARVVCGVIELLDSP